MMTTVINVVASSNTCQRELKYELVYVLMYVRMQFSDFM